MSNKKSESYDFWFNNPEFDEHDQFGEKYYVNNFYKDVTFNLDIPKEGYIVVFGTAKSISFDLLCQKYGYDRCIGFDLYNPNSHEKVIIKDCNELSEEDNIPIAFVHNDIGSMPHTPELKIKVQKWLIKNIIPGGYVMGNNNLNRAKFKFEELMIENGFENILFADLPPHFIKNLPIDSDEGYMISKKL